MVSAAASAGQGSLSSTGVAVGGLIALAAALLGLGLTPRIAGRRPPAASDPRSRTR